jgi:hypothetical protein
MNTSIDLPVFYLVVDLQISTGERAGPLFLPHPTASPVFILRKTNTALPPSTPPPPPRPQAL